MAMKKCKECGTEISSSAKVCPNCGKDQRNFFMKHKALCIILIIVLLAIIASSGENSSNNTTVTSSSTNEQVNEIIEYQSISVDELNDALKNNAAAAKDTYNGKYLEISGRLGVIDSDLKYIGLYSTTDSWDLTGIHCTIKNNEQREIIKTLSNDDTITIRGKVKDVGEILGYNLDITEIIK